MTTRRQDLLIPLFFAACGLLPHLLFSLDAGGLLWMETAWDEHTYLAFASMGRIELYRSFGVLLFTGLVSLFQDSVDLAMIAMDAVAPFACAFLAVRIARALGCENPLAPAALLLLPLTFLSFSDVGVFTPLLKYVSPFAGMDMPRGLRMILPDLTMTFFPLYRTPEPQASLIVALALFYALLRYQSAPSRRGLAAVGVLLALMPFIYISIALACLVFVAGLGFLRAVPQRRWELLAAAALGVCWYGAFFLFQTRGGNAATLIFPSRLPLVTPSVLWGVAGCLYLLWKNRAALLQAPDAERMAFAAFAVPLATLNQQILTGLMVQSRNWEFYANYFFVALGILIVLPDIARHVDFGKLRRFGRYAAPLIVLVVIGAQLQACLRFRERNLGVVAAVALIDQLQAANRLEGREILFDPPALEAGYFNRRHAQGPDVLPGHLSVIAAFAPPGKLSYASLHMPAGGTGFALFARRGFSPEAFMREVERQISQGRCGPDLLYFYAVMDCSGMLSDYRALRDKDILAALPALGRVYAGHLAFPEEDIVLITTKRIEGRAPAATASAGRIRPVTAYAYE